MPGSYLVTSFDAQLRELYVLALMERPEDNELIAVYPEGHLAAAIADDHDSLRWHLATDTGVQTTIAVLRDAIGRPVPCDPF
ncbi:hypothetical protein [Halioglobus sp. HI00S01]|uniref:hypothetical protein n=1 Tax=Halioglobus sp. HI00S01 TaxID=1822214 RepID=UPI0012E8078E|nr:hypothetical protein [Halioglobus sp. HI00S01]